ncbi:hypothetical protein D3C87_2143650 [compost metagenome]
MQSHLCLISDLKDHEDSFIVAWANKEEKIFEAEIRSEREWESKRERFKNESFE